MHSFINKKFWIITLIAGLVLASVSFYLLPNFNTWTFDVVYANKGVEKLSDAKNILKQYPTVGFSELPLQFQKAYHDPKYAIDKIISNCRFYVIPRKDLFKKISQNNRLNNLVSKEQQISGFWYFQNGLAYLCINDKIIESLFLLQDKLTIAGYNPRALAINSAYRSPGHNKEVKGAPMSQHLFGKAMDLRIGDINHDRKTDQVDKQIVYKILNTSIIANKGGLGFYPKTMIVHMDVRGTNARWDNYKRK
jgi:hypothetical protein